MINFGEDWHGSEAFIRNLILDMLAKDIVTSSTWNLLLNRFGFFAWILYLVLHKAIKSRSMKIRGMRGHGITEAIIDRKES